MKRPSIHSIYDQTKTTEEAMQDIRTLFERHAEKETKQYLKLSYSRRLLGKYEDLLQRVQLMEMGNDLSAMVD